MILNVDLDDEQFEDIVEDMMKKIPQLTKNWTNFNASDPGMTIIELFAFMKEMQQYHMNQIGNRHKQKFLKLLGLSLKHRQPASGYVQMISPMHQYHIPKGTQLRAAQHIFETLKDEIIDEHKILSIRGGRGEDLYITFKDPLPVMTKLQFFVEIKEDYPVKRNKIENPLNFSPLVELRWEVYTREGWKPVKCISDETFGMLQRGIIILDILEEMIFMEPEGYALRCVVVNGSYDVIPLIQDIEMNQVFVRQQETMADMEIFEIDATNSVAEIIVNHRLLADGMFEILLEVEDGSYSYWSDYEVIEENNGFAKVLLYLDHSTEEQRKVRVLFYDRNFENQRILGESYGIAGQRFQVLLKDVLYEDFEIMVYDKIQQIYTVFEKVEDFDSSGMHGAHYIFNEETQEVIFGDGDYGIALWGQVLICRLRCCQGKAGGIRAGQMQGFVSEIIPGIIKNSQSLMDGQDMENIEECMAAFEADMQTVTRAVTKADYEYLVKNCEGLMIEDCLVVDNIDDDTEVFQNTITIVVEPYREGSKAMNLAYYKNIYNMLDRHKLVGTKVKLLEAVNVGVEVYLEVSVYSHYTNARDMIGEAIHRYICDGGVKRYGRVLSHSDLYGYIDKLACVADIHFLGIDATGILKNSHGDLCLLIQGVPYVKDIQYTILIEDER